MGMLDQATIEHNHIAGDIEHNQVAGDVAIFADQVQTRQGFSKLFAETWGYPGLVSECNETWQTGSPSIRECERQVFYRFHKCTSRSAELKKQRWLAISIDHKAVEPRFEIDPCIA